MNGQAQSNMPYELLWRHNNDLNSLYRWLSQNKFNLNKKLTVFIQNGLGPSQKFLF